MKLPEGFRRAPPPRIGSSRDDVEDEIRFHVDSRIEELMARGVDGAEARRQAMAEFGDRASVVRRARRESEGGGTMGRRVGRWVGDALRDVAVALRQARRNPALTAAALITLALGVGGTTAIHSVVDGVLFRALPYPDEGRVARVWPVAPGSADGARAAWSIPDLEDWRERSTSLEALGAYTSGLGGLVVTAGGSTPEEVPTTYVTEGFFEALGTPARLGRTFPPGAASVEPRLAVLSDAFWRRRFGADPAAVGATLETQAGPYRIVGVMPPAFAFPDRRVEVWTFLANVEQTSVPWLLREVRTFDAVGRMAAVSESAEADLAAGRVELERVASAIAADFPDTNAGITSAELQPIREAIVGDVRTPLLLVAGAVGLTLLIACANVANLLLARGATRRHEFALRASLGAGRARLVRQVLVESLFLGIVGGALGAVLATWAVPTLMAGAEGLIPRTDAVAVNGRVLAFALLVSAGTGLLVGLLPALGAGRRPAVLSGGLRGATGGVEARGLLGALVFLEVALAVVLLVGGGLLMRSFAELRTVDPGFDPEGLLVADLVASGYEDAEGYLGFRDRLLERLEAVPGVLGATTVRDFPTRGDGEAWPWALPSDPTPLPGEERLARALHVHRDFFEVMRIPLLRGSLPDDRVDVALVINERLAREAFGSAEAAVGSALAVAGLDVPVRAVVGDVLHADPSQPAPPMIYVDDRINGRRVFSFIVRGTSDPLALAAPFRQALQEVDARQPIRALYSARSAYHDAVGQPRFFAFLMTLFGGGAVALAAVGIYGVIAYSVRRRTREIGVRVALGAGRGSVRRMIVWSTLRPVLAGLAVGLAAASVLSSFLTGMLFGVPRVDPLTYGGVALVFLTVALVASWAPAREATRIDPQVALRSE